MTGGPHLRDPLTFRGRVELWAHESAVLAGNPLGDPHTRELPVYVPPGADAGSLPVVFLLAGLTGRGHNFLESHPWKHGVVRAFDQAVAQERCAPAILVLPDCFTRLGGSQYVNSTAVGNYEDHVTDELVPFIDERYSSSGRRAVIGKSSGGFGAMHLSMRHPQLFEAAASISGDCHFEYCFGTEFLPALRGLQRYDSSPAKFLESFQETFALKGDDHAILNMIAMSACYSPSPGSELGFDLPFDLTTGARIDSVWERWLAYDPLVTCEEHAGAWKGLTLLHLECGKSDEFHLQFALRVLHQKLETLGIPHVHEEFEGGHFDTSARYQVCLERVISALN